MKYAGIFLLMFIMVSMKSYAATKDYYSYLTMVLGNAESVKSKEALVNAEEVNKLSSQLYAVPKMSASVTPKTSKSNNNKQFVESKVTLSSLLFEDTIFNNIKAQNYKLLASVVELDKEKERITTAIMSDQIHISLYEKIVSYWKAYCLHLLFLSTLIGRLRQNLDLLVIIPSERKMMLYRWKNKVYKRRRNF